MSKEECKTLSSVDYTSRGRTFTGFPSCVVFCLHHLHVVPIVRLNDSDELSATCITIIWSGQQKKEGRWNNAAAWIQWLLTEGILTSFQAAKI